MASLIKSGKMSKTGSIKELGSYVLRNGAQASNDIVSQGKEGIDPAILALRAENETLKLAVETASNNIEIAREEARKETQAAYKRDEMAALDILQSGMKNATQYLAKRLDTLDGLALFLSQTALEKIVGDNKKYKDLISRMIDLQITGLRKETVLQILVSSIDFPNKTSLKSLALKLNLDAATIKADPQLTAGESRIDLRLGHIELSVPGFWNDIQELFSEIISEVEA